MPIEQGQWPITNDIRERWWVWDGQKGMLIPGTQIPSLQESHLPPAILKTWKRGTWA